MRRRWVGIFALCLAAMLLGTGSALAQGEPVPQGYVVVQFATGIQAQHADGSMPTLEEQGFRQLPIPPGKTAAQYIAELKRQPNVLSAESDEPIFQAAEIPDDPYYLRDQASYLAQIGAPAAWDLAQGNGTVVVAVLDSGLDLTHPEFAGRLWENPADAFSDGVDHDGNGCINDRYGCNFVSLTQARQKICGYTSSIHTGSVLDDSGPPQSSPGSHGTLVAGIIGAAGDNNEGIAGIAWNIKLMPVKVLDCGSEPGGLPSGRPFEVAQGIEYAVKMGANIINLSLAVRPDEPGADSPAVRRAIESAQAAGVLVIAAAGNHSGSDSVGTGYPAAYTEYPNVIAVGASNNLDGNTWAPYSNYGPAIDFAAPGDKIASTIRTNLGLSDFKVPYANASGTSMSTPLVSGMFALMMSRNSRLGYQEYIDIAKATATPAAPAPHGQNWAGAGIINVGAAVKLVPMSISGSALKDWKDVPAGTGISALIDGQECGSTVSSAFGIVSRYSIRVKSAAEQAGCGAPGKTVHLTVGGQAAFPSFTWGGKNEDLGLAGRDVSSISPGPGTVVVQALNGGWSNIGFFDQTSSPANALAQLPTPWTAAYHWDAGKPAFDLTSGAYERYIRNVQLPVSDWLVVKQYDAYWVDAPAGNLASINPNPAPGRIAQFAPGWNNFVYTGSSKEVKDALAGIAGRYSEVLQFDNASQRWLLYAPGQPRYLNDFGGLFKLKVYWIYMTDSGAISMD